MKATLMTIVLVALGGAIGANARFWLGGWALARTGAAFPWGTLLVNLSGSFAVGFVSQFIDRFGLDPAWRQLLIAGVLGGFTTFSAYELESLGLLYEKRWGAAGFYLVGSPFLGLLLVAVGFALGRRLVPVAE